MEEPTNTFESDQEYQDYSDDEKTEEIHFQQISKSSDVDLEQK